jgi:hypothetical protein
MKKNISAQIVPYREKHRPVDFQADPMDLKCALMAAHGASTAWIMKETGLSAGQVSYRVKKAGLIKDNSMSRRDFRNGDSPFSTKMMEFIRTRAVKQSLLALIGSK